MIGSAFLLSSGYTFYRNDLPNGIARNLAIVGALVIATALLKNGIVTD